MQEQSGGSQQQQQQDQGGQGKSDVIELTDDSFSKKVLSSDEPWLVEFYAPWCGHCKNLAPHWAKAATQLKGKINMGALDATEHKNTAAQFSVQGYPTIKFFPAGAKVPSAVEDYTGGRTAEDIVQWGLSRWTDSLSAPEVRQLVGQAVLDTCSAAPLCVVTFLPHILDTGAEGRNNYIKVKLVYYNLLFNWIYFLQSDAYRIGRQVQTATLGVVVVRGRCGSGVGDSFGDWRVRVPCSGSG